MTMTLQNFIARLNWRQILIHFVAFWFFIHAFQTLSYLYDTKLVDAFRQSNGQTTGQTLIDKKIETNDLTYFLLWTGISGFAGLFAGFITSLIISIRRHWFWINSFFAFTLAFILHRLDFLGWAYLKKIFLFLGQRFNNSTIEILVNGIILLTLGMLLLLLKQPNQFIENKKLVTA